MSTPKKEAKKKTEKLTDADNPSLIKAGDEIHLRVFDDFFIETSLPKWVNHKKEWEILKKELKTNFPDYDKIKEIEDPEKQKLYRAKLKKLRDGDNKLKDDTWHIREKHEQSVSESLEKTIVLMKHVGFMDKLKIKLGFKKRPVPVELAFEELKDHLLHISTEEMAERTERVKQLEHKFRESGQYAKADKIKAYLESMVFDATLINAGFTDYVSEDQMIKFVRESERGVMVDFLRYYDDPIPDAVLNIKKNADSLMVFDNYVVAYFSDLEKTKKKVEKTKKEEKHNEAKKKIQQRRDPILFGIIKETRKLYYIADWVTDTDDLTLELLEKIIGEAKKSVNDTSYTATLTSDDRDVVMGSSATTDPYSSTMPSSIRSYDIYDTRQETMTNRVVYTNNVSQRNII